jgi:hypothetical protein
MLLFAINSTPLTRVEKSPPLFLIIMIFSGSEYKIYANAGKWLKDGLFASWSLSPPMLFPLDLESGTLMLRRTSPSFWRLMIYGNSKS